MMCVENYNVDMSQGEFNPTFFAVFVALFQFTRMGCSLIVTQSLGPIISTIMYMFKDIIVFLAIWVIVLHVFIFSGVRSTVLANELTEGAVLLHVLFGHRGHEKSSSRRGSFRSLGE